MYIKHNSTSDNTYTALQSQKAVNAYLVSKQLLPFGFAEQNSNDNNITNAEVMNAEIIMHLYRRRTQSYFVHCMKSVAIGRWQFIMLIYNSNDFVHRNIILVLYKSH